MDYSFGPRVDQDGVTFRLWAPNAVTVDLEIRGLRPQRMRDAPGGWKLIQLPCSVGTLYRFCVDDITVPDPASRLQVGGVHGWSVVCVTPPTRPHRQWKGRPWQETIIYEIHPGLAGGFAGVTKRLPELAELGITAIELMPIADFPGKRNWGYDGVLPFAPAGAYGTPDDLHILIEQAHLLGMMVFLDVVYNHFGPDGNYLPLYAKPFFRQDIQTAWGSAIDFRTEEVRRFVGENIRYWFDEYGMDGLRFDAVHAIEDYGWLDETVREFELRAREEGRHLHFILENECNAADRLRNGFTAQWNDDIHHALHVMLTGESAGYYRDYADAPAEMLAKGLAEGFSYQGDPSPYRGGEPRGTYSGDLAPTSFVAFLHNHDQIGNRAFGERLTTLARPGALKAATALLLLCPQIPLMFMGDEIGSRSPFLYFTDHGDELAKAVREGRQREFSGFFDQKLLHTVPHPNSLRSFESSDPTTDAPDMNSWLSLYRSLISLRARHITSHITGARSAGAQAISPWAVVARWRLGNGERLTIACNLGTAAVSAELPASPPVWGASDKLTADTTLVWIEPA